MIHDRESTEARFFEEYDRMKLDLAEAQQKVMLLTDQLRSADAENQGLAYKVDFLKLEVDRVTASREQYERVAIRVSAKMEAATSMVMGQLADLLEEIKAAAFAEVPGKVKDAPVAAPQPEKPLGIWPEFANPADNDEIDIRDNIDTQDIAKTFGAGFGDSASLLPPARFGFGNGSINS
jgi:hypothetical protein